MANEIVDFIVSSEEFSPSQYDELVAIFKGISKEDVPYLWEGVLKEQEDDEDEEDDNTESEEEEFEEKDSEDDEDDEDDEEEEEDVEELPDIEDIAVKLYNHDDLTEEEEGFIQTLL